MQKQRSLERTQEFVWRFDPLHSTVEFSIKNLFFFTVTGRLTALEGAIVLDESNINRSSVSATVFADSIETGIGRRDAHLRSPKFLDVDKFPEIKFESSSVGPGRDRDTLRLEGTLTIKDHSKPIALEVIEIDRSTSPRGEQIIYYVATTQVDRTDFGITYAAPIVGRRLQVTINIQASRPV